MVNEMIHDVRTFMRASDQTVGKHNHEQAFLYETLVKEEYQEWLETKSDQGFRPIDDLKEMIDTIWVLIGYAESMGYNLQGAWNEVAKSNHAKIDKKTGKVIKREDGKVLKPADWKEPQLARFI